MDTMGQLLKENYDPLKRTFGGCLGSNSLVRTSYSFQCSSSYLCHWQRYVTFNMWVTRVTTVVTIVQGYFWSQLCRNIFGHNCARISLETIVPLGPRPQPCRGFKGEKGMCPTDGRLYLMEVDVLRMLRYCRMSGTVISRNARRNRSPG